MNSTWTWVSQFWTFFSNNCAGRCRVVTRNVRSAHKDDICCVCSRVLPMFTLALKRQVPQCRTSPPVRRKPGSLIGQDGLSPSWTRRVGLEGHRYDLLYSDASQTTPADDSARLCNEVSREDAGALLGATRNRVIQKAHSVTGTSMIPTSTSTSSSDENGKSRDGSLIDGNIREGLPCVTEVAEIGDCLFPKVEKMTDGTGLGADLVKVEKSATQPNSTGDSTVLLVC